MHTRAYVLFASLFFLDGCVSLCFICVFAVCIPSRTKQDGPGRDIPVNFKGLDVVMFTSMGSGPFPFLGVIVGSCGLTKECMKEFKITFRPGNSRFKWSVINSVATETLLEDTGGLLRLLF